MSGGATRTDKLRSVRYDPEQKMLAIELSANDIVEYYGVPPEIYDGLISAPSRERYVETYIRYRFRYRRILRV